MKEEKGIEMEMRRYLILKQGKSERRGKKNYKEARKEEKVEV